jgi:hypothetical protein
MRKSQWDYTIKGCCRWRPEIIWKRLMILSRLLLFLTIIVIYRVKGLILFIWLLLLIVNWLISVRVFIFYNRLFLFIISWLSHLKIKFISCKMISINSLFNSNPNDIIYSNIHFYIIISFLQYFIIILSYYYINIYLFINKWISESLK